MEVATGNDLAIGQNQRVIGRGIGLNLQRAASLTQNIHSSASDLRLTPNAIGVLHPAVALPMAFADDRACQQGAQGRRSLDLAGMTAQGVNLRLQRCGGTHDGVGRQRRSHQRVLRCPPRTEQTNQRVSGAKLGAVDQREAFLRAKHHRGKPSIRKGMRAGLDVTLMLRRSLADHHGGHMGERREVTAGPDRALRGDDRCYAMRQHRLQQRHDIPPNPRSTAPKRQQLQRHHQPDDVARHRIANTAAMRQDQVSLQLFSVLRGDLKPCELAKPGVHAINRRGPGSGFGNLRGS